MILRLFYVFRACVNRLHQARFSSPNNGAWARGPNFIYACTTRYMENDLLARDLKHQLWRINHIPANLHRYPGIIQEKEVGESTAGILVVVAHQLTDLPVQPTCVTTSNSKDHSRGENYLPVCLSAVRGTTSNTAESLSRGAVVYTAHPRACAPLRNVHAHARYGGACSIIRADPGGGLGGCNPLFFHRRQGNSKENERSHALSYQLSSLAEPRLLNPRAGEGLVHCL